jgi:hypothetical protein
MNFAMLKIIYKFQELTKDFATHFALHKIVRCQQYVHACERKVQDHFIPP